MSVVERRQETDNGTRKVSFGFLYYPAEADQIVRPAVRNDGPKIKIYSQKRHIADTDPQSKMTDSG